MVKRRKAVSDEGDSQAPVEKLVKLEPPQIDGLEVRFEWEGDKAVWVRYSKNLNRTLVNAFNFGRKQSSLELENGTKLLVMFDKMVQKNKSSGYERPIRIALKDNTKNEFVVWQWEDESNNWRFYPVSLSISLEKAFLGGQDSVELKRGTAILEVDLKRNTEYIKKSKVTNDIKRSVADSDIPPDYSDEEDESKCDSAPVKEEEEVKPKPKSGGKSKSSRKSGKSDEEEEVKPKPKSGGKSKSSQKSGKSEPAPSTSSVKTVVVKKGSVPVDDVCPIASKTCVHEAGNIVWNCMLNQANISNNNNKYYLIQLLEDTSNKTFHVWQRWGRVGYKGQTNLVSCGGDLDQAKKVYTKKFYDKTGNDWSNKDSFYKIPGKYELLMMDYSVKEDEEDQVDAPVKSEDKKEKVPDSKLEKKIQDLINLICDVKSMEDAMIEMSYDAKKAPLGRLTKDQIKAGYSALKDIEELIKKKDLGRNLADACNVFYTKIPHVQGMKALPLISTPQMVKQKIELLEALEDIQIAIKMLKGGDMSENPVDRHYHQLHCVLDPLDHTSDEFKLVKDYLLLTHANTHNQYSMELLDVYRCDKEGESDRYTDYGNRMLLWHGSRLTNWAGILSQGLRIAPPEAPVTGYMFGKGVYFADMSSKSANYCFASKQKNTGLLLLCDVSLGEVNEKFAADYSAASLPKGKHSVKGVGMIAPDPKAHVKLPGDDVVVPIGKGVSMPPPSSKNFVLNYNEFIVYDTRQIRMKYLVKVKFNFK
ncbi:poly [ADP-ribose] polymerase 2-like isoform X2 [Physella acuta]|uniref:poly [ADP-ribose] polymerase 2-like isoform X2 n=1 Tax=Physella acuta TaxID=109671 RepID=UPI0027DBB4FD|nr:poly [ADP-ribose] polymerase 2-like isoform X2 [Physella acuta]